MAIIGISMVIATLSFMFYRKWFSASAPQLKEQDQAHHEPVVEEKSDNTGAQDEKSASHSGSESAIDAPTVVLSEDIEDEEEDPITPTTSAYSQPFILSSRTDASSNSASAEDTTSISRSTEPKTSIHVESQDIQRAQEKQKHLQPFSLSTSTASTMMPPPPRPRPAAPLAQIPQRTPASSSSSLRVPGSGPLPSRVPGSTSRPSSSSTSSSLMPPPSSASLNRSLPRASPNTSTLNPSSLTASTLPTQKRKKVILSPGHSPIDWAHLIRTSPSTTLTGLPPGRQLRISPSQLALHNGRKGAPAWSAWQGKVYNIALYLPFHPGGEGELLRCAGKSGSVVDKMFMEVHPWVNWENMLGSCVVGVLVPEGEGDELVVEAKPRQKTSSKRSPMKSELDDMD